MGITVLLWLQLLLVVSALNISSPSPAPPGCSPPPANNGNCCSTCPSNHYCPIDYGCYKTGQAGCAGGYCPAPPAPGPPPSGQSISSVSGFSSGACMAGVYFSAFSATTKGVGIDSCGLSYISTQFLAAGSNLWDSTDYLDGKKMFLYAGSEDEYMHNTLTGGLLYQQRYKTAVASKFDLAHPHAWQSPLGPVSECDFVNIAGFDLAGQILQHTYGGLSRGSATDDHIHTLDQSKYLPSGTSDPVSIGLAQQAGAYVPASCLTTPSTCPLHVHFHGCDNEWDGKCGHAGVSASGFNEWAEANGIIILYPQLEYIPMPCSQAVCSCWDYGPGDDTTTTFVYGEGKANMQLQTVINMAAALLENPRTTSTFV